MRYRRQTEMSKIGIMRDRTCHFFVYPTFQTWHWKLILIHLHIHIRRFILLLLLARTYVGAPFTMHLRCTGALARLENEFLQEYIMSFPQEMPCCQSYSHTYECQGLLLTSQLICKRYSPKLTVPTFPSLFILASIIHVKNNLSDNLMILFLKEILIQNSFYSINVFLITTSLISHLILFMIYLPLCVVQFFVVYFLGTNYVFLLYLYLNCFEAL